MRILFVASAVSIGVGLAIQISQQQPDVHEEAATQGRQAHRQAPESPKPLNRSNEALQKPLVANATGTTNESVRPAYNSNPEDSYNANLDPLLQADVPQQFEGTIFLGEELNPDIAQMPQVIGYVNLGPENVDLGPDLSPES